MTLDLLFLGFLLGVLELASEVASWSNRRSAGTEAERATASKFPDE